MRKLTAGLMAALAILAIAVHEPTQAQAAPSGDALAETAAKFRKAYLNGTPDELFNSLAPWLQGRANLFDEGLLGYFDGILADLDEEMRAEFEKQLREGWVKDMKRYDPADKLGIKTFDDVVALSPAQMVAVELNQFRVQGREEIAEHRNAKWHETNRRIYTEIDDETLTTFGEVVFRNKLKDRITVTCVADGNRWQVVDFSGRVGEEFLERELSMSLYDPDDVYEGEDTTSEARTEAEQLMGSGKDYARVQYAKTAEVPKKFSDTIEDFEDEFTGEYFKLRDTIYKKPDMVRGAIVAEPVDDENLGYAALYFNYAGGDTEIKWYDTKDELEKALKAFQTAK